MTAAKSYKVAFIVMLALFLWDSRGVLPPFGRGIVIGTIGLLTFWTLYRVNESLDGRVEKKL